MVKLYEKSNKIRNIVKENSGSILGFSNVSNALPKTEKHLKWAVTIGVKLSDEIIESIKEGPTRTYYHHYKQVNTLIDQIALKISIFIDAEGYGALPVPASQSTDSEIYSGLFSHKIGGTLSGLGWIGKSALFISKDYGPRVRLGTVLTNMPLPEGIPFKESECGECNLCVMACPALAIRGDAWKSGTKREELYDARACSTFMKENYNMIGRGYVCGKCIQVCPKGEK